MRITRGVQKRRSGRCWHDWATSSKWPFGQSTTIRSLIYLHPTGRLARPPLHVMAPSPNQVPSKWTWAAVPQEVASPRPDALLCLSLDVCRAFNYYKSQARPHLCLSGCQGFWPVGIIIIWAHLGWDLEQKPLATAEPVFTPPLCCPPKEGCLEALQPRLEALPSVPRMDFSRN